MMADSFAREKTKSLEDQNDLFAGERLEYPTGSPSRSFLTAIDDMELDDGDDDLFNDLAAAHQHNLATNRDIDPYFVRQSTPPLIETSNKRKQPMPEKDYTQMPTTGAFVSATTSTGKSLYFPKKLKTIAPGKEGEYLRDIAAKKTTGQLLDKPIWQMQKELETSNKTTLERIQRLVFLH
jgi:chromosome transmission fidelity protein 18